MRRGNPEHALQRAIKSFVGSAMDRQAKFVAFDSAKQSSDVARMREGARGIVSGWPDTALILQGARTIWCELKHASGKPTETQFMIGNTLLAMGHEWFWCNSVTAYCAEMRARNVTMIERAELLAEDFDLRLKGKEMRRKMVVPKVAQPFRKRASPAALRAQEAVRKRVMF